MRNGRSAGTPFRVVLWGLAALAVLAAIVAALTGLLLLISVAVGLAILNLRYLPRLATKLRISPAWLAVALLPVLMAAGALISGVSGGAWGAGLWVAGIGLPRVLGRDLSRRVRQRLGDRLGRSRGTAVLTLSRGECGQEADKRS